jgi:hypothetical protein
MPVCTFAVHVTVIEKVKPKRANLQRIVGDLLELQISLACHYALLITTPTTLSMQEGGMDAAGIFSQCP